MYKQDKVNYSGPPWEWGGGELETVVVGLVLEH